PLAVGDAFQLAVVMVSLLEGNRDHLRGHSVQTARLARKVCEKLALPAETALAGELAALFHDLGKAATYHLTPFNVVKFEGHLAAAQKLHGTPARVLESARPSDEVASAVTHMYERYDGQGFPGGLKGDAIPLLSRVIAICDAYTDLTSNPRNSFRKVLTPAEACAALRELAGAVFDPKVFDRFSRVVLGDDIAHRLGGDRSLILVVDPNVEETTALEMALLEKLYDVHVVRTMEEALQFVQNTHVNVVVTETRLEVGSGIELLTALRGNPKSAATPCVFLSQETDSTLVDDALEAGAADYLFKPMAPRIVAAKLKRLLDRAASQEKGRGVSGTLEQMALPDLVQILHQGRKTGALQLTSGGESGSIFFRDGAIVDVVWRGLRGEDAFYALVGLTRGDFTIDATAVATEQTVRATPEMLLLEGMRRLDESGR
ncbi:MAG: DUF4388 domain-containing protein, partial [Deltaproteobacteria bacterium]|nr:DUF4388 domain-containing protein [Deltaproteobacteria bacterium]